MRPLLLLALAACTSSNDIVGPFTGPVTRYVVDGFTLPARNQQAKDLADDLDGDSYADNDLGMVAATLASYADLTTHASDMIAAGVIESSLELQAVDLQNAAKAGATYIGADGDPATVAGGSIHGGVFASNRTRTTHVPGLATLHLPVFADADPSVLELDDMELDLAPDGAGGYNAIVRGGVSLDSLEPAVCLGIQQMIFDDPEDHHDLALLLDQQYTGQLTCQRILGSTFIKSLIVSDVTLGGHPMVSLGFGVHLKPCDSGTCTTAPPADHCHDRLQDGGETGVDCGGSCSVCPVANPSCSDGVRDGLESDVDCGWNCGSCALGKHCYFDHDCGSQACNAGTCVLKP